jgi:hypothetical protein
MSSRARCQDGNKVLLHSVCGVHKTHACGEEQRMSHTWSRRIIRDANDAQKAKSQRVEYNVECQALIVRVWTMQIRPRICGPGQQRPGNMQVPFSARSCLIVLEFPACDATYFFRHFSPGGSAIALDELSYQFLDLECIVRFHKKAVSAEHKPFAINLLLEPLQSAYVYVE